MKERPILFSAPMVRAILAGTKTQTRRVCKPAQSHALSAVVEVPDPQERGQVYDGSRFGDEEGDVRFASPYGQPGDRLWVRETWTDEHPLAIQEGRYSQPGRAGIPGPPAVKYRTIYRADGEPLQIWRNADQLHPYFTLSGPASRIDAEYPTISSNYTKRGTGVHWAPSIHMPRWASRITLEITSVRVEQLQDISEADCIAEGCTKNHNSYYWGGPHAVSGLKQMATAKAAYRDLWESINGSGSWDANAWVWVVEFKRVEGGEA